MWHEWNVNTGDIMVTWFTSSANLVMSCWACVSCGAHAIIKNGMPKYPSGLTGMQADLNLGKITASHFWVLNT